jgi:DNA (cytosine-5)-methyltransferase 1
LSNSKTYKSIDLFAGAGGLSLGLHKAGIETVCAVEYDKHAAATFAKAFPNSVVHCADVQSVDFTNYRGQIDIVCGGPPCQPFSSGGLRNASEDARDMIPAFIRIVDEVAPKAFLMENVNGLTVGERRTYLDAALTSMRKLGYTVSWQVLNAAQYGVPQIRRRLIVVGVRDGEFEFPEPTHGPGAPQPYVTAGDALANIESKAPNNAKVTYAIRPSLRPNPHHGQLFNGGGRPIDLEQPAPTILASAGGNKTHFLDTEGLVATYHAHLHRGGAPQVGVLPGARRLTLEESAAIQTFPPRMHFSGPPSSQYRQIGNAVPPGLAEVLGHALVAHLDAPTPKIKPSSIPAPTQLSLFPIFQD